MYDIPIWSRDEYYIDQIELTKEEKDMVEEIVRQVKESEQRNLNQLEKRYERNKIKREKEKHKRKRYQDYQHIDEEYEREIKTLYGEVLTPLSKIMGNWKSNRNQLDSPEINLDSDLRILLELIESKQLMPGTRGKFALVGGHGLATKYTIHNEKGNQELYQKFIYMYDRGIEGFEEGKMYYYMTLLHDRKIGLNKYMEIGGIKNLIETKESHVERVYEESITGNWRDLYVLDGYRKNIAYLASDWDRIARLEKLRGLKKKLEDKKHLTKDWKHLINRKTRDGHAKEKYMILEKVIDFRIKYQSEIYKHEQFWNEKNNVIIIIKDFINELGTFPDSMQIDLGKIDIIEKIRAKLEESHYRKVWGVATYWELEAMAVKEIIDKNGGTLGTEMLDNQWASRIKRIVRLEDLKQKFNRIKEGNSLRK